jgi:hypothetical protein
MSSQDQLTDILTKTLDRGSFDNRGGARHWVWGGQK